jgi:hypothetical protein
MSLCRQPAQPGCRLDHQISTADRNTYFSVCHHISSSVWPDEWPTDTESSFIRSNAAVARSWALLFGVAYEALTLCQFYLFFGTRATLLVYGMHEIEVSSPTSALKMEAVCSSKILVSVYKRIWRYNPEKQQWQGFITLCLMHGPETGIWMISYLTTTLEW